MRYGTTKDGAPCAITDQDRVIVLDGRHGPSFQSIQEVIDRAATGAFDPSLSALETPDTLPSLEDFAWGAPLPRPQRNVFCVGKNYVDHAKEFASSGFDSSATGGAAVPEHPIIFTKAPETVIGPGETVVAPQSLTSKVDYEAEIAVIIGKAGRDIAPDAALNHVFGYTLVNDVTARDLQSQHKQWFLGKSIDTFCPMGPFITLADGLDVAALDIACHINGDLRQSATTQDLIFDIPSLIAVLSRSLTLLPGDVIATGTPAGVGIGLSPPEFLKDGDIVTVSSKSLGTLTNPIRIV